MRRRLVRSIKKRQKSQPLSFHKEKWLARLSCPTAHTCLVQMISPNTKKEKKCVAYIKVLPKGGSRKNLRSRFRARKHFLQHTEHLPLNAKVFRALDALVAEGKVQTSMPYTEWLTQLALGTATRRNFYVSKVEKQGPVRGV